MAGASGVSKGAALKAAAGGPFTRWALGVLAAGAIAAVSFAWGEISTIGKDVAAIKADMVHVKESLRLLAAERITRHEAETDLEALDLRLRGLERRIERLEGVAPGRR